MRRPTNLLIWIIAVGPALFIPSLFVILFYLFHPTGSMPHADQSPSLYSWDSAMFFIALSTAGSLLVSLYVSRHIKNSFTIYEQHIQDQHKKLQQLDGDLEAKIQARTRSLEKANQTLETLATTDMLTKIYNRYAITNLLEDGILHAHYCGHPLSMMLLDVDHFKTINDTYGHDIGDVVLEQLAQTIQACLRETDVIGRYGGEEFMVIMARTPLQVAFQIAERVRSHVMNETFQAVGNVTVSIGVAELEPEEMFNGFFRRTDMLLYNAKRNGRNCISL